MSRRLSLALVLPLLLVALLTAGCKATTSTSAQNAPASTSAASSSGSGPAGGSGGSAAAGGSGAGGCPTSNTTTFAKTKFVLHSGLAFGAFHRYIYKPFRAGTFHKGAHGRIFAFVKAGVAALFVKREVRLAYDDAKTNPTLCKLIATPLQAVGNKISDVVSAAKTGDVSGLTGLEQTVQDVKTKASSQGTSILENSNAPLN